MTSMDSGGFLPAHNCSRCDRSLHGEDSGCPSELYAGTYTGLCYRCTLGGVYTVHEYPDGARYLSYPPHCPAWSRARECFYTYSDCEACAGSGRKRISRSDGQGGSYYVHCAECMARYNAHPIRKAHSDAVDAHTEIAREVRAKLEKRFAKGDKSEAHRAELIAEWERWLSENPKLVLVDESEWGRL